MKMIPAIQELSAATFCLDDLSSYRSVEEIIRSTASWKYQDLRNDYANNVKITAKSLHLRDMRQLMSLRHSIYFLQGNRIDFNGMSNSLIPGQKIFMDSNVEGMGIVIEPNTFENAKLITPKSPKKGFLSMVVEMDDEEGKIVTTHIFNVDLRSHNNWASAISELEEIMKGSYAGPMISSFVVDTLDLLSQNQHSRRISIL